MKLIAQIQLKPTREQSKALQQTLEIANAACNHISAKAWENQVFGQFAIHRIVYGEMREQWPLSAQVVVRCISKVADAYKLDKKARRAFKPHGGIAFDHHILRYKLTQSEVSIWTVDGRQTIPFVCGDRQRRLLETQQGESDLALVKGKWYLLATCNVEEAEPQDVSGALGVDMGIVELATDSNGHSYSGEPVKRVRRRLKRIRGLLQKKGTKSAKRHLKQLSRKGSNFTRSENHRISKQIVETARTSHKALALEDLKGIRERARFNKEMRGQMGSWAFAQLQGFIEYKAKRAGVPVFYVEARNTSRTCSACGYCDKANRKSQSHFSCLSCGCELNADYNASLNIAARAVIDLPNVAIPHGLVTNSVRLSAE